MEGRRKIVVAILASGAVLVAGAWLWAARGETDFSLTPPVSPKITGHVTLSIRPTRTILHMYAHVLLGSNPVTRLAVSLQGQGATEYEPGRYRCAIEGYRPSPGAPVTVKFVEMPVSPARPEKPRRVACMASASLPVPPTFTSPAPNARVSLPSITPLTVSWSGGTPPYSLTILPYFGDNNPGKEVFMRSGIMGTSVDVPLRGFRERINYRIYLSCEAGDFTFDKPVDPASRLRMVTSVATSITTE